MKRISFFLLAFAVTGFFLACQSDPARQWEEQNLIEHGVPLKIVAPDSIEVKVGKLGDMTDITVKGPDDYSLQIFGLDVRTSELETLVEEQREMVKEETYFKEIVEEWEGGFIYSYALDSASLDYDFRHVRLKGDQQYVFQAGLLGRNSKEQIDRLVRAVREE